MAFPPPPPVPGGLRPAMPPGGMPLPPVPQPSAAAAAGAAAAALLQKQLLQDGPAGDTAPDGGWTEHQTGDGRKFYFHEDTQTSTWEKPEVLKSADERKNDTMWREYRIWDGRVFYHNRETKVSCWSMPPEIRVLRGESSGIDERPLPQSNAEKRRDFWDVMHERGVDENWNWPTVDQATRDDPRSFDCSEAVKKQCFAELYSFSLRQKQIEAREKQRNAANALERLIEERFSSPDHLGMSYEEASQLLEHEEAWGLIKSEVRRDEVFQTVMERLEEKHQKSRTEKRGERIVRLQRLMASDAELKRPRLRWKDAATVLAKRDELQEEDPPIEALRVWSSLRDLKPTTEYEAEAKRGPHELSAYREERKRRDVFIQGLKKLVDDGKFSPETSWAELEGLMENDPCLLGLREGPGASAVELFDEFQEHLALSVPLDIVCTAAGAALAAPDEAPTVVVAAPDEADGVQQGAVKKELHGEPPAKRAKLEITAPESTQPMLGTLGLPLAPPAPPPPPLRMTKDEIGVMPTPKAAPGLMAVKQEMAQDESATSGAKGKEPSAPSLASKAEVMDDLPMPSAASRPAKEELSGIIEHPGTSIAGVMAPKKAAAPPSAAPSAAPKAAPEPSQAVVPPRRPTGEETFEKLNAADLLAKKVDDLRALCRERGLPVSGRKQELVDRLAAS
mmetsp:Transcript_50070/g.91654  ORF Transcript_50070/g.91654 Transcript_50070/m.91654 type:complete len:678 (-) Transcript_50070:126-2159(-)